MNLPAINHSDARRSCGILVHAKMLLGAVLVIAPLLPVTLPSWLTIVLVDAGVIGFFGNRLGDWVIILATTLAGTYAVVLGLTETDRMATRYFGQPIRRNEDARLLTGQALFTDAVHLPGMLHVAFYRSPYARIKAIDTRRAAAMPGVAAVYTAADLGEYWQPGPLLVPPRTQVPLAKGKVRFAGDIAAKAKRAPSLLARSLPRPSRTRCTTFRWQSWRFRSARAACTNWFNRQRQASP